MTSYMSIYVGFGPECIFDPFSMSTPMGDSIVCIKVYKGCVVSIYRRETLVDLIELDMVDFNVISGMDWLHSCYVSLDCRTQKVCFQFHNKPIIKWEGSSLVPKGIFISYLSQNKTKSKYRRPRMNVFRNKEAHHSEVNT